MINKLGFGFLRLPKIGGEPDWEIINIMVDAFMEGGGTFFDTCYTYLDGMSELAIRKCVVILTLPIPGVVSVAGLAVLGLSGDGVQFAPLLGKPLVGNEFFP